MFLPARPPGLQQGMRAFLLTTGLAVLCTLATTGCGRTAAPTAPAGADADDVWLDIQQHWLQTQYGPCLKESGLRMGCGGCPAIIVHAEFVTDDRGGLRSTRMLRENVCGDKASPALRACFLRFFRSNPFPEVLRGKTLEARLGTGLGC